MTYVIIKVMKTSFQKSAYFLLLPAFLTFFSCAARIDGSLSANGSAALSVNISLERGVTALIQRMSAAGGQPSNDTSNILDSSSISKSMSASPGITSANFKNTAAAAIEGQIRISKINEFLSASNNRGFITFDQEKSGGKCVININRKDGPKILEHLSIEISDYLNALMAPIATGEEMTKSEYLELVASFYNKAISDEIASSRIRASVDFPGTITKASGGTFSGKKANFNIPLLDLLVLETPLVFEVTWN